MSVRPDGTLCSHWMDFLEFFFMYLPKNQSRKFKFHENLIRIMHTLHEDQCIFFIISHWVLRMRNVSGEGFRKNQDTFYVHYLFSKIMPFMRWGGKILYSWAGHTWQYGTCTLHAGYISLQTHTQNMSYVLVFCCNNDCASMLHYTYIACLSLSFFFLLSRLSPGRGRFSYLHSV